MLRNVALTLKIFITKLINFVLTDAATFAIKMITIIDKNFFQISTKNYLFALATKIFVIFALLRCLLTGFL